MVGYIYCTWELIVVLWWGVVNTFFERDYGVIFSLDVAVRYTRSVRFEESLKLYCALVE